MVTVALGSAAGRHTSLDVGGTSTTRLGDALPDTPAVRRQTRRRLDVPAAPWLTHGDSGDADSG